MSLQPYVEEVFPLPLTAYPPAQDSLIATLTDRLAVAPFNGVATGIFLLAILHTFAASRFTAWARRVNHQHDERLRTAGRPPSPSIAAELLHFLGEVEVVFGLWAVVLIGAIAFGRDWSTATHYIDGVAYVEPLFVFVIMSLSATRPIVTLAESTLALVAKRAGDSPAAWWLAILSIGPVLGSFITEPAAMTICALLLARKFYDLEPSSRLKYATLGLLFVNVSIGGTLTNFAAPPILMVARPWGWDTLFVLGHFGWRSVIAILIANVTYFAAFRTEFAALARKRPVPDVDRPEPAHPTVAYSLLPVPAWLIVAHMLFMAWTVFNAHSPALFLGGFLIFLGFARATAVYQSEIELKGPLLVGFFLAGLVIHGGLQGWWIAPVLASLSEEPLFFGAAFLTAFNDNALITYLSSLVPGFSEQAKIAVVEGAVTGGGLTVIANAPNPAGQALLSRFFGDSISPFYLALGAIIPTLIAILAFRML